MAGAANLPEYIQGRVYSYDLPPWHLISRTVQQAEDQASVIAYRLPTNLMNAEFWTDVGLFEYWFARRGIELAQVGSATELDSYMKWALPPGRSPWLVYQRSVVNATRLERTEAVMSELGYQACRRVSLEATTEMVKYSWYSFNCTPQVAKLLSETRGIKYEFFGHSLDPDTNRPFFSDCWTAKLDFPMDGYNMSFQVVSTDWKNVAQLDLPLVSEGELRQYWIDVSDVPRGAYRLMGILYNAQSGERESWHDNFSYIPELLDLGEVVVG